MRRKSIHLADPIAGVLLLAGAVPAWLSHRTTIMAIGIATAIVSITMAIGSTEIVTVISSSRATQSVIRMTTAIVTMTVASIAKPGDTINTGSGDRLRASGGM